MRPIEIGSLIGIPCAATEGAFEDEVLVEFETLDGIISGFAPRENVKDIAGQTCIKAKVLSVENNHLVVRVEGSFFSTNGLANVETKTLLPLAA